MRNQLAWHFVLRGRPERLWISKHVLFTGCAIQIVPLIWTQCRVSLTKILDMLAILCITNLMNWFEGFQSFHMHVFCISRWTCEFERVWISKHAARKKRSRPASRDFLLSTGHDSNGWARRKRSDDREHVQWARTERTGDSKKRFLKSRGEQRSREGPRWSRVEMIGRPESGGVRVRVI